MGVAPCVSSPAVAASALIWELSSSGWPCACAATTSRLLSRSSRELVDVASVPYLSVRRTLEVWPAALLMTTHFIRLQSRLRQLMVGLWKAGVPAEEVDAFQQRYLWVFQGRRLGGGWLFLGLALMATVINWLLMPAPPLWEGLKVAVIGFYALMVTAAMYWGWLWGRRLWWGGLERRSRGAEVQRCWNAEVPGKFSSVREAERTVPDAVVMDIRLPGQDGLAVARALRARLPQTRVVILTEYDGRRYRAEAKAAGCSGYLLKSSEPEALVVRVLEALRPLKAR